MNVNVSFLDPAFQQDVVQAVNARVSADGFPLRFEHLAIRETSKGSMRSDLRLYQSLRYRLVKDAGEVLFFTDGITQRIELIPHNYTEHVGYIVPYGQLGEAEYTAYGDYFSKQTCELGKTWRLIESEGNEARVYAIFKHVSTGLHLQLLHRQQALFPDLWQ